MAESPKAIKLYLLGGLELTGAVDPALAHKLLAQPKLTALLAFLSLSSEQRPQRRDGEDQVEHLQGVDGHGDEHHAEHRCEQRDGDPPKHLPLGCPVDPGRFEQLAVERGESGADGDHGPR